MTKELEAALKKAGYTKAQIEREARYLERVALENTRIRNDRAWGFGIHHADAA